MDRMVGRRNFVRIFHAPWHHRCLELMLVRQDYDANKYQHLESKDGESYGWVESDLYGSTPVNSFRFEREDGQQLMDDLWAAGIRPTEASGSTGALQAVKEHIKDLRSILFHREGITQ
jgi:hypothetical protein